MLLTLLNVGERLQNVRRAAWRWRFTKRWQQEQAKQFDPDFGKGGNDEEWDEVRMDLYNSAH